MFTTIDKALVALVMSLLYLANNYFGVSIGISEETVNSIITGITPILVWLIPNKAKAE